MFTPKRICKNCTKGTLLSINNDVLCKAKGIVSPDYVCSAHRFAPSSKISSNTPKCIDCEFFITAEGQAPIGNCDLFSTRKTDGSVKNTCSKFQKSTTRNAG